MIFKTTRQLLFLFSALATPGMALGQGEVPADINANYKSENLEVGVWVNRFEVEGREVYDYRHEIIETLGIQPGQVVADVGAGTGLFVPLLAEKVGPRGTLYAVDIAPKFIEHIQKRAEEEGLLQVKTVLNGERSVNLPDASVDIVFTSDVYHHFVHYEDMLASIHAALKPGGEFIVVEFDKELGRSSAFIQKHIRDTKEVFTAEIEATGFRLVEDMSLPEFRQTFIRRFVKQ